MLDDDLPIALPDYSAPTAPLHKLSPTDISQFIRLEQCKRYLRLHLLQRAQGLSFLTDYGVSPQAIPPLLTKSGGNFEERIEADVRTHSTVVNFSTEALSPGKRNNDNEHVISLARNLSPGQHMFLFQVRIVALIEGWLMRGDIDLLRMERDPSGGLHLLIADMKSSTAVKVEHRLQIAFYHTMLSALFSEHSLPYADLSTAILYRGAVRTSSTHLSPEEQAVLQTHIDAAGTLFGVADAYLEVVSPSDQDSYLQAVRDLVTDPNSTAHNVVNQSFSDIPFHLTYKCDGCLYNEFCMKWSAENDDLSLLPHITALDKEALRRQGITTVSELAALKDFTPSSTTPSVDLQPAPTKASLVRKIATSWPVGPRIDELVHRAKNYRRWKRDPAHPRSLSFIPNKGHGTLPYTDPTHNPNLVRVYIDAQHDYLNDRIYMLGSLVTACVDGIDAPHLRRSIVHITDGPPDTDEKETALFVNWVRDTMEAVVELAAPDPNGERKAPVHLIFYNSFDQKVLLDGLGRNLATVMGATPLYDFITQTAAFDSPLITYLDQEIRDLRNYPMVSQSLYSVAAYLKFDWESPKAFRHLFRERIFDFWGKLDAPLHDGESAWYTSRSRFNSQIPLEYAHAAWGELPDPATLSPNAEDTFAPYRLITLPLLLAFQQRRLEALEHIAHDFKGNHLTEKTPFDLPDLSTFTDTASSLAGALQEFVTIERHVDLAAWKSARNMAPERRVLTGETLLLRYAEADQDPVAAAVNQDAARRAALYGQYEAAYLADNPGAPKVELTKQQKQDTSWSLIDQTFTFHIETVGTDSEIAEVLGLTTLRQGDRVVLYPRHTYDTRLPLAERTPNTPTPKQMLYGVRGEIDAIYVERDPDERATSATLALRIVPPMGSSTRGFTFPSFSKEPLADGALYTIDPDPNDIYGYWCLVVADELRRLASSDTPSAHNALYDRVTDLSSTQVDWGDVETEAQARFLHGLDALHLADPSAMHDFEQSKREYIATRGADPVLLVQGPPGTGKSYSTSFAIFARLQGALAANRDMRIFISCNTHAAIDVLLEHILSTQHHFHSLRERFPDIFATYFDPRLLTIPLFRISPKRKTQGITPLPKRSEQEKGDQYSAEVIAAQHHCIVGGTPGGIYGMIKDRWTNKNLSGHYLCHTLVLDEASQMDLPKAAMAALPVHPNGQLIVVGDPRQMPPIVKHNWESERRRTFQQYKAYSSLFDTLLSLDPRPPMIKFSESFRLHADMAQFLKEEVYSKDGIDYHSNRHRLLPHHDIKDHFVAAVLSSEHPLVIILHDEAQSQSRNPFEQLLVAPILNALASSDLYNLDLYDGLGVVVPHRAQRGDMQSQFTFLNQYDPITNVMSNGDYVTAENVQILKNAGLDSLTLSLHSYTEPALRHLISGAKLAAKAQIIPAIQAVLTTKTADRLPALAAHVAENGILFSFGIVQEKGGGFSVGKDRESFLPTLEQEKEVLHALLRLKKLGFVRNNRNYIEHAADHYPNNWKCDPERDTFIHIGAGGKVNVCSDVRTDLAITEIQALDSDVWREVKRSRVSNCGNCLFHCYYEAQNPDLMGDLPTGVVSLLIKMGCARTAQRWGQVAVKLLKQRRREVNWELAWHT